MESQIMRFANGVSHMEFRINKKKLNLILMKNGIEFKNTNAMLGLIAD